MQIYRRQLFFFVLKTPREKFKDGNEMNEAIWVYFKSKKKHFLMVQKKENNFLPLRDRLY